MNELLVTIGTDQCWAPPMPIPVELTPDLTIRSTYPAVWTMEDEAILTRTAVYWRDKWRQLKQAPQLPASVVPGQRVELSVTLDLDPGSRSVVDIAEGAHLQIESFLATLGR